MNTVETKPVSAILLLRVVSKRPVLHSQLHKFGKIIVKCNIMIQLKQKRNLFSLGKMQILITWLLKRLS